ncbi:hypothetical protein TUM4630_10700 [Shewanella algidipiscicola]|uniref:Uncharacterized protein n=1 Tax=Shewanella algidipiscicola TaxID=614070 RepID=A0ABQ4PAX2_9GAMM|nr:hypothetical protein TUM4630_10700 [Shewanella algidipiscicola]
MFNPPHSTMQAISNGLVQAQKFNASIDNFGVNIKVNAQDSTKLATNDSPPMTQPR